MTFSPVHQTIYTHADSAGSAGAAGVFVLVRIGGCVILFDFVVFLFLPAVVAMKQ